MEILRNIGKEKIHLSKIMILTHGDADGLTSAMIIQTAVEKLYKNKFEILILASMSPTIKETEKMLDWITERFQLSGNDKIYIVDRAMPSIKYLDKNENYFKRTNIISIDHHLTNHPDLWRKTKHSSYISFLWDDEECGATLSLEWFKENLIKKFPDLYKKLKKFSNRVKLWDIFTWTKLDLNKKEDEEEYVWALSINAAEKIYGDKYFYKKIMECRENLDLLDEIFMIAYEAYQEKYKDFFRAAVLESNEYIYDNLSIKTFYNISREYQAIFSHELLKNSEADILVFINPHGIVSLRSKNDIDVSLLAKELGEITGYSGGGHKNASAYKTIENKEATMLIENHFIEDMKKLAYKNNKTFKSIREETIGK